MMELRLMANQKIGPNSQWLNFRPLLPESEVNNKWVFFCGMLWIELLTWGKIRRVVLIFWISSDNSLGFDPASADFLFSMMFFHNNMTNQAFRNTWMLLFHFELYSIHIQSETRGKFLLETLIILERSEKDWKWQNMNFRSLREPRAPWERNKEREHILFQFIFSSSHSKTAENS